MLPSVEIAVIVTLPADIPVINPPLFTVAMAVLLEVQISELFVALLGSTVAKSITLEPTFTE